MIESSPLASLRRATVALVLCFSAGSVACQKSYLDPTLRPCRAGDCPPDLVCHPETNRCVTPLAVGCDGVATCPSQVSTGTPCTSVGSFVPCLDSTLGCEQGCRTCQVDRKWSACSLNVTCQLGTLESCSSCTDRCVSLGPNVQTPACGEIVGGHQCTIAACVPGWSDADGDPTTGCEATCVPTANPTEICDGVDNNCDGIKDPEGTVGCQSFYADRDGDGFGAGPTPEALCLCEPRGIYAATAVGDCDDNPAACGAACSPSSSEECDNAGYDNDCDGLADGEEIGLPGCVDYWPDADGDTYGSDAAGPSCRCTAFGVHTATRGGDCDDNPAACGAACYSGAPEVCDTETRNNDCDGTADANEIGAVSCVNYFVDADGDGFGSSAIAPQCRCAPTGQRTATQGGDCDDVPAQCGDWCYPGANEVCDGFLNDCTANPGTQDDGCTVSVDAAFTGLTSTDVRAIDVGLNGDVLVGTASGAFRLTAGATEFNLLSGTGGQSITAVAVEGVFSWVGYDQGTCDGGVASPPCECGPDRVPLGRVCLDDMAGSLNWAQTFARGEGTAQSPRVLIGTPGGYNISNAGVAACDLDVTGAGSNNIVAAAGEPGAPYWWLSNGNALFLCEPSGSGECPHTCQTWDAFPGTPANDGVTALDVAGVAGQGPLSAYVAASSSTGGSALIWLEEDGDISVAQYNVANTTGALNTDNILDVAFDPDRWRFFLATSTGVYVLNLANAVTSRLNSTDGLPSNNVRALAIDRSTGDVWVATSAGVARLLQD